jgi:hypothetical protein
MLRRRGVETSAPRFFIFAAAGMGQQEAAQ